MHLISERTVGRLLAVAFAAALVSSAFGEALIVINEAGGNQATAVGGRTEFTPDFVTPPEAGAMDFDLELDTTADILIIAAELSVVSGEVFKLTPYAFRRIGPGSTCFIAWCGQEPGQYWNWWVTTPSTSTWFADVSDLLAGDRIVHFDAVDDGPQTEFTFAHFTLLPDASGRAEVTLDAWIQTAAQPTPVMDHIRVTMLIVPEPDAGLLGFAALLAFAIMRRTQSSSVVSTES